jgi:UDP-N-acetylmuramyl pentapeptide synthase
MEQHLNIVKPNIRILTNIYDAHLENFLIKEDYYEEKLKFIRLSYPNSQIIVNNDNLLIKNEIKKDFYSKNNINIIRCGQLEDNDIRLVKYNLNNDNISSDYVIKIKYKNINEEISFNIKSLAEHTGINICLAISCALLYNIPLETIKDALEKTILYKGRGGTHISKKLIIFDHSYNLINMALLSNLKYFNNLKIENKIFIIGDEYFKLKDEINGIISKNEKLFIFSKRINENINLNLYNNINNLINNINKIISTNNNKWYIFIQTQNYMFETTSLLIENLLKL